MSLIDSQTNTCNLPGREGGGQDGNDLIWTQQRELSTGINAACKPLGKRDAGSMYLPPGIWCCTSDLYWLSRCRLTAWSGWYEGSLFTVINELQVINGVVQISADILLLGLLHKSLQGALGLGVVL